MAPHEFVRNIKYVKQIKDIQQLKLEAQYKRMDQALCTKYSLESTIMLPPSIQCVSQGRPQWKCHKRTTRENFGLQQPIYRRLYVEVLTLTGRCIIFFTILKRLSTTSWFYTNECIHHLIYLNFLKTYISTVPTVINYLNM